MQPDSAFYRLVFNISLKCSAHLSIPSLSSGIRATYVCLVVHALLNCLLFTIEHRCAGIQRIISTVLSSIPFFLDIFLLHYPIFRISLTTCCNVSPLIHGILYIFFHPMMSLPCPPFSSTLSHFPSLHCLTFITFETCFWPLYIELYTYISSHCSVSLKQIFQCSTCSWSALNLILVLTFCSSQMNYILL